MAEVVPASAKHHLPLEGMNMHSEFAPLVGRQSDELLGLEHEPLPHHLLELGRDDEHG